MYTIHVQVKVIDVFILYHRLVDYNCEHVCNHS